MPPSRTQLRAAVFVNPNGKTSSARHTGISAAQNPSCRFSARTIHTPNSIGASETSRYVA